MLYFGQFFKNTDWYLFMKNSLALSVVTASLKKIFISNLKCCKYIGPKIFQTSFVNVISFGNFLKKNIRITGKFFDIPEKYFVI